MKWTDKHSMGLINEIVQPISDNIKVLVKEINSIKGSSNCGDTYIADEGAIHAASNQLDTKDNLKAAEKAWNNVKIAASSTGVPYSTIINTAEWYIRALKHANL